MSEKDAANNFRPQKNAQKTKMKYNNKANKCK